MAALQAGFTDPAALALSENDGALGLQRSSGARESGSGSVADEPDTSSVEAVAVCPLAPAAPAAGAGAGAAACDSARLPRKKAPISRMAGPHTGACASLSSIHLGNLLRMRGLAKRPSSRRMAA